MRMGSSCSPGLVPLLLVVLPRACCAMRRCVRDGAIEKIGVGWVVVGIYFFFLSFLICGSVVVQTICNTTTHIRTNGVRPRPTRTARSKQLRPEEIVQWFASRASRDRSSCDRARSGFWSNTRENQSRESRRVALQEIEENVHFNVFTSDIYVCELLSTVWRRLR